MKRDPKVFLEHMREAICLIEKFSKKKTLKDFQTDLMLQSAVVRQIEILGEAVKNLPLSFRSKNPQVDWSTIARTRDKIIHQYFGVNEDIVWGIVKNELPNLKQQIEKILSDLA